MKTLTILITFFAIILGHPVLFAQWIPVHFSSIVWESVFFTDANTGYVCGETYTGGMHASLMKTTNAGINWFELPIPPADTGAGYGFTSVFFISVNTGFITRGTNNPGGGMILKTTDGGNTWDRTAPPGNNNLLRVYFVNPSTGFISGYQIILKTTNAGANWVYRNPNFSDFLFQICFTDINTGYVVGFNGAICKTTDSGDNWFIQSSGTVLPLWGIGFSNANTGFAVGGPNNSSNIILKTTNGGNNWAPINYTYSTCLLWSVRFISQSTGYILGNCGQILKTSDGGANWCYQLSLNCNYSGCFFTSSDTGYLIGSCGRILKTTNGGGDCTPVGIEPVSNGNPSSFYLFQNYPNPFNPITQIKFSLPLPSEGGAQEVSLVVYDVLGRKITTLFSSPLGRTGGATYEVNWDASNFSSGVYYYILQAGEYKETKKMVLIK